MMAIIFPLKALFIDSYVKRTDMNIARTPSGSPQAGEFQVLVGD